MKSALARTSALLAVLCVAPTWQSASAQALLEKLQLGAQKIQQGCAEDVAKFCSNVSPGEGRLYFCILAHEDKVSMQCDYALFSAARNLERALDRVEQVADACWTDIETNCANAVPGNGNIMQCLAAKASSVSPACASVLKTLPAVK